MRILGILIILVLLPVSIPLMFIGALARILSASVWYGWELTDTGLANIASSFIERKPEDADHE